MPKKKIKADEKQLLLIVMEKLRLENKQNTLSWSKMSKVLNGSIKKPVPYSKSLEENFKNIKSNLI